MEILAIDQSMSCTGWARWKTGDAKPVCGHFAAGISGSPLKDIFTKFARSLTDLLAFQPDLVVFETPLRGDAQSSERNNRIHHGLSTIIILYCAAKRIRCQDHDNNAWKSSFFNTDIPRKTRNEIGKLVKNPRYDPKEISSAMARAFGFEVATHDEADACGLLDHAIICEGITAPWRVETPLTPVAELHAA